jgi:iron complex transport system ATP-binding protein
LLRIGSGVLLPSQGRVLLGKKDLRKLSRPAIARVLGYLPQELESIYDLSAEDIVRMGRYPHTTSFSSWTAADREAVDRSLRFTEIQEKRAFNLSHLSGGEKKRTFLASVLAQEPEVMLLDEPTSSLDIHHQIQFFSLLRTLAAEGMAVAVATHDLNLASLFSDRLLVLDNGKAVTEGTPQEVLSAELIHQVYGENILLGQHPEVGRPTLLPRLMKKKNP